MQLTPLVSSPKPILAKGGELFVLLAGRPSDQSYLTDLSSLQATMVEAGGQFSFDSRLRKNRRGDYRAISTGVTHGGGSKVRRCSARCQKALTVLAAGSCVSEPERWQP
jgi:hypothetical protein